MERPPPVIWVHRPPMSCAARSYRGTVAYRSPKNVSPPTTERREASHGFPLDCPSGTSPVLQIASTRDILGLNRVNVYTPQGVIISSVGEMR